MTVTRIFKNEDSLFKKAAELIIKIATQRIAETGRFSIALSGGNTPLHLYELLASPLYAKKINWQKVFVFWSDERHVAYSDPDNNSNMAMKAMLERVPIPETNIYRVLVDLEPGTAAKLYEKTITVFFGNNEPQFDLILLGLGEDGHTASLFPGTDILQDTSNLVKNVYLEQKHSYRISFTVKLINNAKNILFLVSGSGKAAILNKVISRKIIAEQTENIYPARLIKPMRGNKLYWYVDKAAASLLHT